MRSLGCALFSFLLLVNGLWVQVPNETILTSSSDIFHLEIVAFIAVKFEVLVYYIANATGYMYMAHLYCLAVQSDFYSECWLRMLKAHGSIPGREEIFLRYVVSSLNEEEKLT